VILRLPPYFTLTFYMSLLILPLAARPEASAPLILFLMNSTHIQPKITFATQTGAFPVLCAR
jgi:hypothetical protein